ncbi:MAG: hypothetical protein QM722_00465 [Piscinibacter sp.]
MAASSTAAACAPAASHGGGHRLGGLHLGGHRHIGGHRHGHWRGGASVSFAVGAGVIGTAAVIADSCYRIRWVDTPYGLVRQRVKRLLLTASRQCMTSRS